MSVLFFRYAVLRTSSLQLIQSLLFHAELHNRESHRVEEHGAYVEEVTVKQAHTEKGEDGDGNIDVGVGTLLPKHTDGINSVVGVGDHSNRAAGGENLNDGVVPARREEGAEGLYVREIVHREGCGIEGLAEYGVIKINLQTVYVDVKSAGVVKAERAVRNVGDGGNLVKEIQYSLAEDDSAENAETDKGD